MVEYRPISTSLIVFTWSLIALLRVLVGFQPHSGQDDYHGLPGAYGGDFEVQRHWMELTYQLPIGDWYYDEPNYFGLDYPPLTAYISYVCGWFSDKLVGPHTVALYESRGIEDPTHKAFMRATVLVLDLLAFGSAVWSMTKPHALQRHDIPSLLRFIFVMSQPALILIDHGHFQYNSFALGLCLWAFYYISKPGHLSCIIGSVFFCMALSFKQMTLYFAPAVFFYLLGRCCADHGRYFLTRFTSLGAAVITTFLINIWPIVMHGPEGTTVAGRFMQLLRRIFPLHRGLFESKVANIWCVLSLKPMRARQRIPAHLQPLAALCLTLLLLVPTSIFMFRLGVRCQSNNQKHSYPQQRTMLMYGLTASAFSFFLASFQVHEKSILLALAPASLLVQHNTSLIRWISIVAAWSLWPLLQIDRLEVAYFCVMTIFTSLLVVWDYLEPKRERVSRRASPASWMITLSYSIMVLLHVLEWTIIVPSSMPDLFSVLWSIFGCACFGLAWMWLVWELYRMDDNERRKLKIH